MATDDDIWSHIDVPAIAILDLRVSTAFPARAQETHPAVLVRNFLQKWALFQRKNVHMVKKYCGIIGVHSERRDIAGEMPLKQ